MSLYGIDLIVNEYGTCKSILEINGMNSGMHGFKEVYSDDRVSKEVFKRLEERYGLLSFNDGSYLKRKEEDEHPWRVNFRNEFPTLYWKLKENSSEVLDSPDAHVAWLDEEIHSKKSSFSSLPLYLGQESCVFDPFHQHLPHRWINEEIPELVSKNKLFQYLLLKATSFGNYFPLTAPVGLGIEDRTEIIPILKSSNSFILKPLLGSCGRGVRLVDSKELRPYLLGRKPIKHLKQSFSFLDSFFHVPQRETYLEDLILKNDFTFEYGLSVVQPFVGRKQTIKGKKMYTSVRAIVCNGKFIDAYTRCSLSPIVNLSLGAKAVAYEGENLRSFCEELVTTFEKECEKLKTISYSSFYLSYLNKRKSGTKYLDSLNEFLLVLGKYANTLRIMR